MGAGAISGLADEKKAGEGRSNARRIWTLSELHRTTLPESSGEADQESVDRGCGCVCESSVDASPDEVVASKE